MSFLYENVDGMDGVDVAALTQLNTGLVMVMCDWIAVTGGSVLTGPDSLGRAVGTAVTPD